MTYAALWKRHAIIRRLKKRELMRGTVVITNVGGNNSANFAVMSGAISGGFIATAGSSGGSGGGHGGRGMAIGFTMTHGKSRDLTRIKEDSFRFGFNICKCKTLPCACQKAGGK